jgi:hypothetical protein
MALTRSVAFSSFTSALSIEQDCIDKEANRVQQQHQIAAARSRIPRERPKVPLGII